MRRHNSGLRRRRFITWCVSILVMLVLLVTLYDLETGIIKLSTDDASYSDLTSSLHFSEKNSRKHGGYSEDAKPKESKDDNNLNESASPSRSDEDTNGSNGVDGDLNSNVHKIASKQGKGASEKPESVEQKGKENSNDATSASSRKQKLETSKNKEQNKAGKNADSESSNSVQQVDKNTSPETVKKDNNKSKEKVSPAPDNKKKASNKNSMVGQENVEAQKDNSKGSQGDTQPQSQTVDNGSPKKQNPKPKPKPNPKANSNQKLKSKTANKGSNSKDESKSDKQLELLLAEKYGDPNNSEEALRAKLLGRPKKSGQEEQRLTSQVPENSAPENIKEGTIADWKKKLRIPQDQEIDYSKITPARVEAKEYPEIPNSFSDLDIKPLRFRIYSHNVKNGGHEKLVPGEEIWGKRLSFLVSSIIFNAQKDTIVALQEVYKFQLDDILRELNKYSSETGDFWKAYGAGRIDGDSIGEFVPILYRESEWELAFADTLWLNGKDPRTAYNGWDAKYLRIASYCTLRHKNSENYINVFNSHFDHVGELSRIGSSKIITDKMAEINGWPSIFCGDLNSDTNDGAYEFLTKKCSDVSLLTTAPNVYGHSGSTVTGFMGEVLSQGGQYIDHIFVPLDTRKINDMKCQETPAPRLRALGFGLLHSRFSGIYMSDHRPVVADLELSKC